MSNARGNRNLANRILLLAFMLFMISLILKGWYGDVLTVRLFRALTEAALVGSIADWFAVTALFRRPLGFPWHTAIIPRNRARIVEAITHMVSDELLSPDLLYDRLKEIKFVTLFVQWVEQPQNRQWVGRMLLTSGKDALCHTNTTKIAGLLAKFIGQQANQWSVVSLVKQAAALVSQQGYFDRGLNAVLAALSQKVNDPCFKETIVREMELYKRDNRRTSLLNRLVLWLGEKTDSVNVDDAASSLQDELASLLLELTHTDHPLREWIKQQIINIADSLTVDQERAQVLEKWKNELVGRLDLTCVIRRMLQNSMPLPPVQASAITVSTLPPLLLWGLVQLERYWEAFKADTDLQDWLEGYVHETVRTIIQSEHHVIGNIVQDTLNTLSDEGLNDFIENKAGDDLQWIRVNGSVVGAIVGCILFGITEWIK